MARAKYGYLHKRLRKQYARRILSGETFLCTGLDRDEQPCRRPVLPGQAWDLGHTDDGTAYLGPEHASCNRRKAAVKLRLMRAGKGRWLTL